MAGDDDLYELKDDDEPEPARRAKRPSSAVANADAGADAAPRKLRYRDAGSAKAAGARSGSPTMPRAEWEDRVRGEQDRQAWLQPTIALGTCAAAYLLMGLMIEGVLGMAVLGLVFIVTVVANAVLSVIAAYIATFVGVGFGAPLLICILQLAAASTIASVFGTFFSEIVPLGCLGFVIYVAVLAIALQLMLEMEGGEANVFILIFVVLQLGASVGLAVALEAIGANL